MSAQNKARSVPLNQNPATLLPGQSRRSEDKKVLDHCIEGMKKRVFSYFDQVTNLNPIVST